MNKETVVVIFRMIQKNTQYELEIPRDITANDLIEALNIGYGLNIDVSDIKNNFLRMENPIALVKGKKTLGEIGIRDGSVIIFTQ